MVQFLGDYDLLKLYTAVLKICIVYIMSHILMSIVTLILFLYVRITTFLSIQESFS